MTTSPSRRVLLVDDEPHVLDGLRRLLRLDFDVQVAVGGEEALARIRASEPFAVILSDFQMPGMNGAEFLAAARAAAPETSRLLLTGQADLAGAAAVVNRGAILRLLLKPAGQDELREALEAGVEQHRLVTAERDLLDHTLRGSVRALTEVLALASPTVFARSVRLRDLVTALGHASGTSVDWHVELAAMLTDMGAIALPTEVWQRAEQGVELAPDEEQMVSALPEVALQVLAGIPRIDDVRDAIASQIARYDGGTPRDTRSGDSIPLGGRLLRLARDYDLLETAGTSPVSALTTLRCRTGAYDPALLDALALVVRDRATREPIGVTVGQLVVGMVLAADVTTRSGTKLVARGNELSLAQLTRIRNYAAMDGGVQEPVTVFG